MIAPIALLTDDVPAAAKREALDRILKEMESVLVAFSGGADSSLLLRVAHDVLGTRAAGALAVSKSLAPEEADQAFAVAAEIGTALHVVETLEFENERYLANGPDRCYHCKVALFDELEPLARRLGLQHVVYGANLDDLGDFRPGQQAAKRRGVRAPLLEAGFTKMEIREHSRRLGLSTWNKPAMACLSSRVPFGTRIDVATLERIAAAERWLRGLGIAQVRVRTHGDVARIETDSAGMDLLMAPDVRKQVSVELKRLGYAFVALDLEGFRSGSLNPQKRSAVP